MKSSAPGFGATTSAQAFHRRVSVSVRTSLVRFRKVEKVFAEFARDRLVDDDDIRLTVVDVQPPYFTGKAIGHENESRVFVQESHAVQESGARDVCKEGGVTSSMEKQLMSIIQIECERFVVDSVLVDQLPAIT